MDSLKLLLKNKVLILVIIIFIAILLVVYFFLNRKDNSSGDIPEGSIRQPLVEYPNNRVGFSDDVKEEYDPTIAYNIFDIKKENRLAIARDFVNSINKAGLKYTPDTAGNFTWTSDPASENTEFIMYNSNLQSLTFSLREYPKLNLVDSGLIAERKFEEFFKIFVREYLKADYEYSNFKTIEAEGAYMITANRNIDGLEVYNNNSLEYTEYLLVTRANELLGGQFTFLEVDNPKEASILNTFQLSQVISRTDYPKMIHQLSPKNFDYSLYESEGGLPPEEVEDYGDGPTSSYTLDTPTSCNAKEVKIGYLFEQESQNVLVPTFRVVCTGVTKYKGQDFEIDLVVFASAIDPKLVYVPPKN